jgi:uncharacterized protein (TIGR04255 family)
MVVGVQFAPAKGYGQVRAWEVWQLFRQDYPVVQEREALPPTFETFGPPSVGAISGGLNFVTGALHDRFWFLRQSGDELLQFQQDRLLHNWRSVGDRSNDYPRFEKMAERFATELRRLEDYFSSLSPQVLNINQCEISYVNNIEGEGGAPPRPIDWLKFASFEGQEPENFTAFFCEIIKGQDLRPVGRFTCQCSSGINPLGNPILVMALTVRGTPSSGSRESALDFIQQGRNLIVQKFAELTTATAHAAWGRKK